MTYGDTCGQWKMCYPKEAVPPTCVECATYWSGKRMVLDLFSVGGYTRPGNPVNQSGTNGPRPGLTWTPVMTSDIPITGTQKTGVMVAAGTTSEWYNPSVYNPTYGYLEGVSPDAVMDSTVVEFAVTYQGNFVGYQSVGFFWSYARARCVNFGNPFLDEYMVNVNVNPCHTPGFLANSNIPSGFYQTSGSPPDYSSWLYDTSSGTSVAYTEKWADTPDCLDIDLTGFQNYVNSSWGGLTVIGSTVNATPE